MFGVEVATLEKAETSQSGRLNLRTVTYYFGFGWSYCLGFICLGFVVLNMIGVEFLRIYADRFMGTWAERDSTNTEEESSNDFQTYCIWLSLAALGAFLRAWLVIKVALTSSKNIHHRLLQGIMSASLEFFDTIPRGRLLSLFSKDIDAVDALLPQYLLDFLQDRYETWEPCNFAHVTCAKLKHTKRGCCCWFSTRGRNLMRLLGVVVVCIWSTPFAATGVVPVPLTAGGIWWCLKYSSFKGARKIGLLINCFFKRTLWLSTALAPSARCEVLFAFYRIRWFFSCSSSESVTMDSTQIDNRFQNLVVNRQKSSSHWPTLAQECTIPKYFATTIRKR